MKVKKEGVKFLQRGVHNIASNYCLPFFVEYVTCSSQPRRRKNTTPEFIRRRAPLNRPIIMTARYGRSRELFPSIKDMSSPGLGGGCFLVHDGDRSPRRYSFEAMCFRKVWYCPHLSIPVLFSSDSVSKKLRQRTRPLNPRAWVVVVNESR